MDSGGSDGAFEVDERDLDASSEGLLDDLDLDGDPPSEGVPEDCDPSEREGDREPEL